MTTQEFYEKILELRHDPLRTEDVRLIHACLAVAANLASIDSNICVSLDQIEYMACNLSHHLQAQIGELRRNPDSIYA